MKVAINNDNIEFKANKFINSEMSYVGIYGQCSKLISTNIYKTFGNKLDIFPIAINKDWAIAWLTSDYILKNPNFTNQEVNGWMAYIKDIFYEFPQVESIYYTIEEDKTDIWLIIPKRDFSLVRRLVDLEMSVLDTFEANDKLLCQCEFHILYRGRNNEADLIPQRALRISK